MIGWSRVTFTHHQSIGIEACRLDPIPLMTNENLVTVYLTKWLICSVTHPRSNTFTAWSHLTWVPVAIPAQNNRHFEFQMAKLSFSTMECLQNIANKYTPATMWMRDDLNCKMSSNKSPFLLSLWKSRGAKTCFHELHGNQLWKIYVIRESRSICPQSNWEKKQNE